MSSHRNPNVEADERRFEGLLVAADDTTATFRVGEGDGAPERTVNIAEIDRARTVFVWGPQPKKGGKGSAKKKSAAKKKKSAATSPQQSNETTKESS